MVARVAVALALFLAAHSPVVAQTNDEIFPAFQWNFATPGARANAMGGAFLGLADDATASTSNPAGLISLTTPQVHLEYKRTKLENARLAAPSSLFNAQQTSFPVSLDSLSFLSASFPLGNRATVGVTRHEFLNLSESFTLATRTIPGPGPSPGVSLILFPVQGSYEFKGDSYSGSIAVAVGERISVGATVSYSRFSADTEARRFNAITRPGWCAGGCNEQNVNNVATSDVVANRTAISGDDHDVSFIVGMRASPTPRLSFGAMYSHAPSFELVEDLSFNPGFVFRPCCGTNRSLVPAPGSPIALTINVPHRIGAGVAVRPLQTLLLTSDVTWTGYSRLTNSVALVFDQDTDLGRFLEVPNAVEVHAGGEFQAVGGRRPLLVRAGIFTNPSHLVRFNAPAAGLDASLIAQYRAIYNTTPERTEIVGTLGIGFVVAQQFQIDAAYVGLSQRTPARREFVVSAAIRFPN
jgi:long-chain fatty acid transport protein